LKNSSTDCIIAFELHLTAAHYEPRSFFSSVVIVVIVVFDIVIVVVTVIVVVVDLAR
jgi:hypothetical protein